MPTIREKMHYLIENDQDEFSFGEIIDRFGQDGFFALLFIISFPTSIPTPAYGLGTSTMIGGLLSIILSIQLILGFDKPYFPEFIRKLKVDVSYLRGDIYLKFDKILREIESKSISRYTFLFNFVSLRLIALFIIIPSGLLMLVPLVFTNLIPSMIITFVSLNYLIQDGLYFLLSCFVSLGFILFYIFAFKFLIMLYRKHKKEIFKFLRITWISK